MNPMINIEQLWRDYSKYEEASEPPWPLDLICLPTYVCTRRAVLDVKRLTCLFRWQGINVHLAKKMIEDRSRDYMNARRVAKVKQVSALQHEKKIIIIAFLCKLIHIVVLYV